jgi:hypothetical protein
MEAVSDARGVIAAAAMVGAFQGWLYGAGQLRRAGLCM